MDRNDDTLNIYALADVMNHVVNALKETETAYESAQKIEDARVRALLVHSLNVQLKTIHPIVEQLLDFVREQATDENR